MTLRSTKKAIVLLSGGLDSTTTLAIAKNQGYECYTLNFCYGQKHSAEVQAAKDIAQHYQVKKHELISLDLGRFGGSSLTDATMSIPDFVEKNYIPSTYVPARNTIFLSIALAWAETLQAYHIFFSANVVDYSGYPDCRPSYIEAFERTANLATRDGTEGHQRFRIHAPLLHLSKTEIILLGTQLGVDYAPTVSCYRANEQGEACGSCDCCHYRRQGFSGANLPDPTRYASS